MTDLNISQQMLRAQRCEAHSRSEEREDAVQSTIHTPNEHTLRAQAKALRLVAAHFRPFVSCCVWPVSVFCLQLAV